MDNILYSAAILLAVTSVCVMVSKSLGFGTILGLLISGVFIGPHTLGIYAIKDVETTREFTEFGIVLLLFVIGLEMQPKKLWSMRRDVFGLGTLQVLLTGFALSAYFYFFKIIDSTSVALLIGFTFALSSTAFVMQIIQEKGEIASIHGRSAFSILLFQDLAVIPLMAIVPILSSIKVVANKTSIWTEGILVLSSLVLLILFGRYLVPKLLEKTVKQRNKDAFFMSILLSVVFASYMMEHIGLSMALGAFLMGSLLSMTQFNYQIEASIEPYKWILMSLFFIAVGMSIDFATLLKSPFVTLGHILGIICIKIVILFLLALAFKIPRTEAIKLSFLLAQCGEFGFVLLGLAKTLGVINDQFFVIGLGVISITMLMTPFVNSLGEKLSKIKEPENSPINYVDEADNYESKVILAGYGDNGQIIAGMLKNSGIPFIVFETHSEAIALGKKRGIPIFYGDITDSKLLSAVKIGQSKMVIFAIDYNVNTARAVDFLRKAYPDINILASAIDIKTMDRFIAAGANKVIAKTVESSIQIGAEALSILGVHDDSLRLYIDTLRKNDYATIWEMTKK